MPKAAGTQTAKSTDAKSGAGVASSATYGHWFRFWTHIGFSLAVASKAAQLGLSAATDLGQMFAYVRGTGEYKVIFPNIDVLGESQGWDFSDYANSPEANMFKWKQDVARTSKQFGFGAPQTADFANYAFRGWGTSDVGQYFGGKQWVNTNRSDINFAFGSFGSGMLNADQLDQLAMQEGGLPSTGGSRLDDLFKQAMARAQKSFQGVTGQMGQTLGYVNPQQNPDTGA